MIALARNHKTFLLTAVALALGVQNIAFNLGAYSTIFFDRLLPVWAVSLAVLLAVLSLPPEERPIGRWGLFALAAPTLWIVLSILSNIKANWSWVDNAVYLTSIVVLGFILPYTAYLIISITQSEALEITPNRLLYYLVGIALLVGIVSYLLGVYNYYLLTCDDFIIAGYSNPENCYVPPES